MKRSVLFLVLATSLICKAQDRVADPLRLPVTGLPQADPDAVKMNRDSIQKLVQWIGSTPPNDLRGVVVIRNNKLVVEEYFGTFWRDNIEDIRSAGKGITSLLMGIAIDKGLVKSVEQNIYDFFPVSKFRSPPADGHKGIKIKHLLMMSSGLDADDDNNQSAGNTGNWLTKDNWVDFATALPMVFKPGEKYVYNDVCPMLIGAIIEETSGKKLADFARENLFAPLGIREFYWYTAPNGRTTPMGNLYMSSLDLAKIGQLVLSKGSWQGKQIISPAWIHEVCKMRFDLSASDPFAIGYGYFWFIGQAEINHKMYDYVYASGNGGNRLFVVPGENLVVSVTSSAYGQRYAHRRSLKIFKHILGAIAYQ